MTAFTETFPDPSREPIADLPALAVIAEYLRKRPAYLADRPFGVPPELFAEGLREMGQRMKQRGFPVPTSADVKGENFMFYGAVIVPNG